jgi:hypothetical protein
LNVTNSVTVKVIDKEIAMGAQKWLILILDSIQIVLGYAEEQKVTKSLPPRRAIDNDCLPGRF